MNSRIKLGELATFRNGLNYSKESFGTGCKVIGVTSFKDRVVPDYEALEEINPDGVVSKNDYLKSGDVVFVRSNGNKALVGRSLFIEKDETVAISGFCIRARLHDSRLLPKYFAYFTKTDYFKRSIGHTASTSINNLSQGVLADVEVPLPSRIEQNAIVEVLDEIQEKITLNNKINAELEAMAKLTYDYWFIQFDFPDENGKPYKSSGGKMVWCDQLKREVPEGWETGSLSDFGRIIGGSTPSKENDDNFAADGIPWITPNDLSKNVGNNFISRGQTDVSEVGRRAASLKLLPTGAVLLSSRAPIGYMAIARNPVTTNQGFKSFVPTDGFPSAFIFFAVKRLMPSILRNASGSTFKEISGGTLGLVKTSLPDKTVVKDFCKKVQPMLDMQNTLETQNQELANLRDWLLPMLMNGQVTVGA